MGKGDTGGGIGTYADYLRWGLIDKQGEWVLEPQFRHLHPFKSGFAVFGTLKGKMGFVDLNGKIVVKPTLLKAQDFSEGRAFVVDQKNGGHYIDTQGRRVGSLKLDNGTRFVNGLAGAEAAEKWGVINKQGEWVIEPTYEWVQAEPALYYYNQLFGNTAYFELPSDDQTKRRLVALHKNKWWKLDKDGGLSSQLTEYPSSEWGQAEIGMSLGVLKASEPIYHRDGTGPEGFRGVLGGGIF